MPNQQAHALIPMPPSLSNQEEEDRLLKIMHSCQREKAKLAEVFKIAILDRLQEMGTIKDTIPVTKTPFELRRM